MAVDHTLHAEALDIREILDLPQRADLFPRALGNRLGDRVLRRILQRPSQCQHLAGILALGGNDIQQGHLAGGDGAGLVEHHGIHTTSRLQHFRTLDHNAQLRTATGADQQRGRCGQSEGARAGDDQHRDRGGEGRGDRTAGAQPESERGNRQRDHDRHENPGDAVRQPLGLRLTGLRVFYQFRHLGQLGVGADAIGAHHDPPADIDRRTDDRILGTDLDRHRFSREHRGVDRRRTLDDHTVGGDLFAGPHHEDVANAQLLDRNSLLDCICPPRRLRRLPSPCAAQHGNVLRAELQQCSQRSPGPPLGTRLEVASGQDEGGDSRRGLQIDTAGAVHPCNGQLERVLHTGHSGRAPEQRVQRPTERRERAHRHQGVHGGGAVPQVGPRGSVEGQCAPDHDRCGQHQRKPLPVVELQRGHHCQCDDRNRQRQRNQQSGPQCRCRIIVPGGFRGLYGLRQRRGVTGLFDRGDQLLR